MNPIAIYVLALLIAAIAYLLGTWCDYLWRDKRR